MHNYEFKDKIFVKFEYEGLLHIGVTSVTPYGQEVITYIDSYTNNANIVRWSRVTDVSQLIIKPFAQKIPCNEASHKNRVLDHLNGDIRRSTSLISKLKQFPN